jgi:hypothetical protein
MGCGSTALELAVLRNRTSIVSALLSEFGCDPNDGVSLHTACRHGNLIVVKILIDGANVECKNVKGTTPAVAAYDHTGIVLALVSEILMMGYLYTQHVGMVT